MGLNNSLEKRLKLTDLVVVHFKTAAKDFFVFLQQWESYISKEEWKYT